MFQCSHVLLSSLLESNNLLYTEESGLTCIGAFQILCEKKKLVESEEKVTEVISHSGVCVGVATVVAAVWDLLSTPSPPLLLCLGSATRDKEVVVSLAASYLGEIQLKI